MDRSLHKAVERLFEGVTVVCVCSKCNMMVMDLGEFKIDSVKQERVSALPSPTELTGDYQV